jgi:hypothetical protein
MHQSLKQQIAEEILRQAHATFNLAHRSFQGAIVMTAASAIVSLVGVGLLLNGKTSEGTLATAGGLVSGAGFLQLTKDAEERLENANERLDKVMAELGDAEPLE